jgi:hypothetical protein
MSSIDELVEDIESYQELRSLVSRFGDIGLVPPEYDELPRLTLTEDARKEICENRKLARLVIEREDVQI